MKQVPVVVIALAVIAVLATFGVSYGLWTQSLYANGTVETGYLNAQFEPTFVTAPSSSYVTCTASRDSTDPNLRTIKIDVGKAYPGAVCTVTAYIDNNSTVPVKVTDGSLTSNAAWIVPTTNLGSGLAIGVGAWGTVDMTITIGADADQNNSGGIATFILTATQNTP